MPDNQTPELVSMAQQFTGLPMRSLIGGPLTAAAQANSMMAVTQTNFMLDTCFNQEGEGETRTLSPVMVTMSITRGVITETEGADGNPGAPIISNVTTSFDVPLLTLIPLNSLGVTDVEVGFEMEVKSSYSDEATQESSSAGHVDSGFESKLGVGWFSVEVKGNVSYDSSQKSTNTTNYQKSNSAQYTVSVKAGQLPLPEGVTTIIQAYTNCVSPITLGSATQAPDA
jgi:hypothetical protein